MQANGSAQGARGAPDKGRSSTDLPGTPSTAQGTNLADMQDHEGAASCAILLPNRYDLQEGSELWGGVKLGRLLGAGVQARVFELVFSDGKPTGKVLKISHTDLGHKILNNPVIWIPMEREWQVGGWLRAALEEGPGQLPGFMRICDCLVRSQGAGGEGPADKARFSGMIMEKLNGWEVYKRIDTPEFHNIHYVREMLFQVFSALDRAQRKLGFHHADLGMRNVMEHYPRLWEEVQGSEQAKNQAAMSGTHSRKQEAGDGGYEATPGALPGETERQATGSPAAGVGHPQGVAMPAAAEPAGLHVTCVPCQKSQRHVDVQPVPTSEAEQAAGYAGQPWWRQRSMGIGGSCGMVRPKPGFSCNADGSKLPLGPNLEFKIIDFGVAVFDERLAQAAGGYESEEVMAHLSDIFAAKHISFQGQKGSIELETSEPPGVAGRKKHGWHLLPTGMKNRFRVKQAPRGATPIRSAESLQADGLPRDSGARSDALAGAAGAAGVAAATTGGSGDAKSDAAGAGRVGSSRVSSGGAVGADEEPERPQRLRSTTSSTLRREPGASMARASAMMRERAAAAGDGDVGSRSLDVRRNPQRATSQPTFKQSPIEKMYRRFWQRKGDVFHLLLGMAIVLDDRVWPKEDERDVQLFISLVHHVTGVKMRASFAEEGRPGSSSLFGRLACGTRPRVKGDDDPRHRSSSGRGASGGGGSDLQEYGRWGKWHHWFRRMHIRFQAHTRPFNSGLLAGEALVAPFFGAGRAQHAKLPVCVEQAFPRSA